MPCVCTPTSYWYTSLGSNMSPKETIQLISLPISSKTAVGSLRYYWNMKIQWGTGVYRLVLMLHHTWHYLCYLYQVLSYCTNTCIGSLKKATYRHICTTQNSGPIIDYSTNDKAKIFRNNKNTVQFCIN